MYTVLVKNAVTHECIDARDFAYGTWAEIGFWLDHYGYNDPGYYLKVMFTER